MGWLFISPAIISLGLFLALPLFASFGLSLTDFNVFAVRDWGRASFIGLANYQALFRDPLFWISLRNTLYFAIVAVPLSIAASLTIALLLNRKDVKMKRFFRLGYFLPVITTTAAVAVVWRWVLNPRFGIVNWLLSLVGIEGPAWLADPRWAMPALIAMVIWRGLGWNMIIFLAGLQGIPKHYYEAAQIDGANGWQLLWHITVPLLRPTMFFVTIMTIIGYLQFFEEPFIMTDGGPLNATISVVLYIYRQGFRFFNLGYASALAYVLFMIIITITLLRIWVGRTSSEY